ncbi:MAG: alpha/beta hydrolase [Gammaproteobacteria bacterium]|nr:alpha/beta hydrolase [Gammaproteobacteria bacterium]MBU0770787.1 alpha/beta hydrolase [Gammaproteobacteria bacterium]MBU0857161.1 alpha/beta hydrolase [Gammaproteobacteria bacterium]MBU1846760.1 alpha/beta hydrolase [Gammaproteobacteria bacterium]
MRLSVLLCAVLLPLCLPARAAEDSAVKDLSKLSYDARLTGYEYAFAVKFFPITSQGQSLEMAYIFLPGEAGKPVVTLLHGKNFNADYWASTARHLQKQGYGVLMPDQIGFGKSSKPVHYQYSFPALASNTRALMKSLGIERSVVIGHSMGGMLASRFALMFPQTVQQLVLVNPIGLENYLKYAEYKDTDFFYKAEQAQTAAGIAKYQRANYYAGQWNERYEALTRFLVGQIQGPDKAQVAWVNALTYDMIFTQPVVTEFGDLSVPVSLIIGTRDRTAPGRNWMRAGVDYEPGRYDRLGKTAAALIPGAALYELPGLGHLPQIEDFDVFSQVLDKALAGRK